MISGPPPAYTPLCAASPRNIADAGSTDCTGGSLCDVEKTRSGMKKALASIGSSRFGSLLKYAMEQYPRDTGRRIDENCCRVFRRSAYLLYCRAMKMKRIIGIIGAV